MFTRKKISLVAAAVLLPILAPSVVSAQDERGPSVGCGGETNVSWPGVRYGGHETVIYSTARSANRISVVSLPVAVAAGTYEIDTVAYDGGSDRVDDVQPQEQFLIAFYDAADQLIDRTPLATPDLPDGVDEAEWAGSLGQVVLDRPAVRIQAEHASRYFPPQPQPNSVMPVCVGWTRIVTPTTTTTTTTTEPVETTTTTTTTTVEPPVSTSTTTTTTTIPTVVLPEVEENPDPDPDPVIAIPTFTG